MTPTAMLKELVRQGNRFRDTPIFDDDFPAIRDQFDLTLGKAAAIAQQPSPTVICLCGSTRFWEAFRDHGLRLTLEGRIVLSIGICAPDSMVLANPDTERGKAQKAMLDDLHKRKIDLADEVFILNVGGYMGESTRGELEYARARGKVVRFLEPEKV